ncbi:hypothetical protein [Mycobacterium sp.]|uniref:hypothetical protein n=1 Tax=Mycobacterium sp. TaxID=1785 RepID=UPI003F98CD62
MTVSPQYYITESPWLMSIQIGWEEKIYNTDLPYWMRVFAVAMARSEPNLHTQLQPGELASLLGKPQLDGTLKPVDRRDLNDYVKKAVKLQLLDETSSVRCLVLPASTAACRRRGYNKPCQYHTGESSKIKRPLAIKQPALTPVKRANSNDALPHVTSWAVGQDTRHCRVKTNPTPGSRDILMVKTQEAEVAIA